MAENCQNCNEEIALSFCGNCGQKKYKRIDKKYIWDEIQYTILHTNKGFLYSVKNIFKNPGKTAKEYINGNRVNHYKPILLVFVLSGIASFISYKILHFNEVMSEYFSQQHVNSKVIADAMTFLSSYNAIIMLLFIPFFSIATKIAFRKWGQNYYEHVVMNAYILSFYTLMSIFLVYPIMAFYKDSATRFYNIAQISILLTFPILIWFFKEFYNDKPLKSVILRVIGVVGLVFLGYILIIILIVLLGILFAMMSGKVPFQ